MKRVVLVCVLWLGVGCQSIHQSVPGADFEPTSQWPLDSQVKWLNAESKQALIHRDHNALIQTADHYAYPYHDIIRVHAYHALQDVSREIDALERLLASGYLHKKDVLIILARHDRGILQAHQQYPLVQLAYINKCSAHYEVDLRQACMDGNYHACVPSTIHPPKKIVLLLPLKGQLASSGRAFRQGFMSSMMLDDPMHRTVETLDTSTLTMDAIAQKITALQPDWIVGPMERTMVPAFIKKKLPYPTLLLTDCDQVSMGHVYCFSIAAATEVPAMVSRLHASGVKKIWLMNDSGAWHQQWGSAFEKAWQRYGTLQVSTVEDSYKWKKTLQALHPEDVLGYQAIILNMPASKIQVIKGTIDYNWMLQIPVMAPSHVGEQVKRLHVGYCDAPWVMAPEKDRLPESFKSLLPTLPRDMLQHQKRFVAWGVDAYTILRTGEGGRLALSATLPVDGVLGGLYLHHHKLIRMLQCAEVQDVHVR